MSNQKFLRFSPEKITDFLVLGVSLLYICLLSRLAFDPDLAILTSFAERMLQGYQFTDMYYEANPPLSMILYAPAVWIEKLSGLPIYHATFVYTTSLLMLIYGLSCRILWQIKGLDADIRHFIALAYLLLIVIVPSWNYGDRDHLCVLGITLFVLAQLALIQNITLPKRILFPALIIGTLLILVKPHYGLIPTAILVYKFFRKDGFKVVLQPDFLALAAGVLIYAGVLAVFFMDYLQIALMDTIKLYAGIRDFEANKFLVVYGVLLGVILGFANSLKQLDKAALHIINFLGAITFLLFIPYYVQGKGFDYHKIPAYIFWFLTAATMLYALAKTYMRAAYAKPLALLILIIVLYLLRGLSPLWLTHKQFEELPLLVTVNKYCPEACNYLVWTDTSDDNHRIGSYSDHFHASRFTSMWFLGYFFYQDYLRSQGLPMMMSEQDYAQITKKYITMVEDDFKRMPPDIIIELKSLITYQDITYTEYLFEHSPYIHSVLDQKYEIVDTLEFDRRLYYPGLNTPIDKDPIGKYVVYRRKGFDGHNAVLGPPPRQSASIRH